MSKVKWYNDKAEAQADAIEMRKVGYPLANVRSHDFGSCDIGHKYYICTHLKCCTCGMCPVLQDDGTVRDC